MCVQQGDHLVVGSTVGEQRANTLSTTCIENIYQQQKGLVVSNQVMMFGIVVAW